MPGFSHEPHGFHPAEDLLDPFALPHAHRVTGVARRATVDGGSGVGVALGHMRRDVQAAHAGHVIARIIVLFAAQGHRDGFPG